MGCLVLGIILGAGNAEAAGCGDLKGCAKAMHDLTGQRYVWEADADKSKLVMVPEIELTKENAEIVFTALLDQVRLARVLVGDGKTYRIVTSAQRKEMELPVVEASADRKPQFPQTWDWITMRYRPKSPERSDSMERAYRLHLPRESRLQSDLAGGFLLVSAAAPVVRQMYETLKAADVQITPALRKSLAEQEKAWREQSGKK
jgi:hypothetical protein